MVDAIAKAKEVLASAPDESADAEESEYEESEAEESEASERGLRNSINVGKEMAKYVAMTNTERRRKYTIDMMRKRRVVARAMKIKPGFVDKMSSLNKAVLRAREILAKADVDSDKKSDTHKKKSPGRKPTDVRNEMDSFIAMTPQQRSRKYTKGKIETRATIQRAMAIDPTFVDTAKNLTAAIMSARALLAKKKRDDAMQVDEEDDEDSLVDDDTVVSRRMATRGHSKPGKSKPGKSKPGKSKAADGKGADDVDYALLGKAAAEVMRKAAVMNEGLAAARRMGGKDAELLAAHMERNAKDLMLVSAALKLSVFTKGR
jgi:hypothetical protein